MAIEFKPLTIKSKEELEGRFHSCEIRSCEYNFNTLFLWNNLYETNYYIGENYTLFLNCYKGKYYTMMPLCDDGYCQDAFEAIWKYFKHELGLKLEMYAIEEKYVKSIQNTYEDRFYITEERDSFDYIYSAEELRTLKGKKFHKKRNHVNGFMRDYEGRYEYRAITKEDIEEVMECLKQWHEDQDETIGEKLRSEAIGIVNMMKNMDILDFTAGGIWIDNKLEAFTIGSYANNKSQAIIHIEKANTEIRGLYATINQMFLNEAFPNIETVNREDDLGIPGIRKAKLSYNPIDLLKKYTIIER